MRRVTLVLTGLALAMAVGCGDDDDPTPVDDTSSNDDSFEMDAFEPDTAQADSVVADTTPADTEPADTTASGPPWDPNSVLPTDAAGRALAWALAALHQRQGVVSAEEAIEWFSPTYNGSAASIQSRMVSFYGLFGAAVVHDLVLAEADQFVTVTMERESGEYEFFSVIVDVDDTALRIRQLPFWTGVSADPEFGGFPIASDEVGFTLLTDTGAEAEGYFVELVDPSTGERMGKTLERTAGPRGYTRMPFPDDYGSSWLSLFISGPQGSSYFMSNLLTAGYDMFSPGVVAGDSDDPSAVTYLARVVYVGPPSFLLSDLYWNNEDTAIGERDVGCATLSVSGQPEPSLYYGTSGFDGNARNTSPFAAFALIGSLAPNEPHTLTAAVGEESVTMTLPPLPPGAFAGVTIAFPWNGLGMSPEPDGCAQDLGATCSEAWYCFLACDSAECGQECTNEMAAADITLWNTMVQCFEANCEPTDEACYQLALSSVGACASETSACGVELTGSGAGSCLDGLQCVDECGQDGLCYQGCLVAMDEQSIVLWNAALECVLEQCGNAMDLDACELEARETTCSPEVVACQSDTAEP